MLRCEFQEFFPTGPVCNPSLYLLISVRILSRHPQEATVISSIHKGTHPTSTLDAGLSYLKKYVKLVDKTHKPILSLRMPKLHNF
jgi:hypothetical protein